MELEGAVSIGARITGALHTQRHDDATAAAFHSRRSLSHQQEEITTLMHNAEPFCAQEIVIGQTAPDLAEGQRCIKSQSEDDQISNSAVHGLNQIEDIKEGDNMNSLKDYEIHTNNVPESMLSQESSSNMTMVVSKQGLCTASVKIQAKLDREDNKKAFTYEDSDFLENKDGTESLKKVMTTEEHDRCTPCANSHIIGTSYIGRSPMDWFPRRRTDSYLERKIRMLQEVEGMNATLDETLGGSNPHLSRIEREKLAAQAAAGVAMEAHKAALVEAAWCRILKAARIPCELAEVQLQNAEKKAAEAFDAAAALGVVMRDKPGVSKQSLEVKTSTANGSQMHIVSASLKTAFEVDKEVAGAVKAAFSRLTQLPASAITDIFNVNDNACRRDNALDNDSVGFDVLTSENGAQTEGEHQTDSELKNNTDTIDPHTNCVQIGKHVVTKEVFCKPKDHPKSRHSKKEPINEVRIQDELINVMLERVKLLKEEELVSLAMIVATRGLSAILKEENKEQELNSKCNSGCLGDILVKHVSRLEAEKSAAVAAASKVIVPQDSKKKTTPQTLPDLGSILVKHVSKLEREVQEARKLAKAVQSEDHKNGGGLQKHVESLLGDSRKHGSFSVRHALNSEREVPVATELMKSSQREEKTSKFRLERDKLTVAGENTGKLSQPKAGLSIKPSMETDMHLFLDVNNDDKENEDVNSASNKVNLDVINPENINNLETIQKSNSTFTLPFSHPGTVLGKHEMKNATEVVQEAHTKQHNYNEKHEESLDKALVEHVSKLEKEELAALTLERESSQRGQKDQYECRSLDKILIKHVSQLEKLKMAAAQEGLHKILKNQQKNDVKIDGLDKILIQHVSRLEREKQEASPEAFQWVRKQHHHDENNLGSLDKVLVKHVSRLEKEKQEASPEAFQRVQREQHHHDENSWGSLDKVLVKHISRLEKEKLTALGKETSQEHENNSILKRNKNARDQEIQHAWRGMSLGNSLRPHLSQLELDKAAWLQAEEEELNRTTKH